LKAILLAGGRGTRLHPTTKVINKHGVLIFDLPMIFFPIMTLRDAGITDIILTLGDHDTERFFQLLGDGSELGVKIDYHYHGAPKGIAYAINMCKDRVGDEPFIVLLGDNLFCDGLEMHVKCFKDSLKPMVVLKKMPWAQAKNYGVAYIENGEIEAFAEKPTQLFSDDVVLGVYFLDKRFFEAYRSLKASDRGEYEITDALHAMREYLSYSWYGGRWFDLGTFEDILEASIWRREQADALR